MPPQVGAVVLAEFSQRKGLERVEAIMAEKGGPRVNQAWEGVGPTSGGLTSSQQASLTLAEITGVDLSSPYWGD